MERYNAAIVHPIVNPRFHVSKKLLFIMKYSMKYAKSHAPKPAFGLKRLNRYDKENVEGTRLIFRQKRNNYQKLFEWALTFLQTLKQ